MGQAMNGKKGLSLDQKDKHQQIGYLITNGGNKAAVALRIGCSVRTINRLIRLYHEKGEAGFIHGNANRRPTNYKGLDDLIVERFSGESYEGCNIVHFCELLKKQEGLAISEGYVRSVLKSHFLASPKAQRKTKNALRKRLREEDANRRLPPLQKEQLVRLEAEEHFPLNHPTRSRCKYMGEQIQLDASQHRWFGCRQAYLHLAIDDATGALVGAFFDWQETLKGYYQVLKQILEGYGIPNEMRTDRRTVFIYRLKKDAGMADDTHTQFGFACSQLGIQIECSSVPEFKGRVERSFQTLQSRLVVELRLADVKTIEAANDFLHAYIPAFNRQFAVVEGIPSCFDPPPSSLQILHTLVVHDERTIDKGNCISIQGTAHRPIDSDGRLRIFPRGTKVGLIKTIDGSFFCTFNGEILAVEPVLRNKAYSPAIDDEKTKPPQREKPQIPPPWHPWRLNSFQKFKTSLARVRY